MISGKELRRCIWRSAEKLQEDLTDKISDRQLCGIYEITKSRSGLHMRMDRAIMLHDTLNIVCRPWLCNNWGLLWRNHVRNVRDIELLISAISHHSLLVSLMTRLSSTQTHCVENGAMKLSVHLMSFKAAVWSIKSLQAAA